MRRNRIILLLLWIASLVCITVFGGQVSYGVFILLTLIPLVSLFYIFCVARLFRIYQHVNAQDLVANHTADFEFILQNDSIIPFSSLRIAFFPDFSLLKDLDPDNEYELLPNDRISKQTSIICRYRGEYKIGIDAIVIQDFFRLFAIRQKLANPLLVKVRPDVIRLPDLKETRNAFNTVSESHSRRNAVDVLSRDYIPGDDPRLINWKLSASFRKLLVREQIGEEQLGVGLIMDPHRYANDAREYLPIENKILETVVALALFFTERGIPVTTYLEESSLSEIVGETNRSFDLIYERLSSFIFAEIKDSEKLCTEIFTSATIFNKRAVYFVLHEWDEHYAKIALKLSEYDIPAIICIISSDHDQQLSETKISEKTEFIFIDPEQDLREAL